jgi:hypothetical protein
MDNILKPSFGGKKPQQLPFEIRFGESQNAVMCQGCKTLKKAGYWVIYGQYVVLVCMQCTAAAIMKYQETHILGEKIFQVDAEVPPEVLSRVIGEVTKENPDLPEEKVDRIVRSAIEKI